MDARLPSAEQLERLPMRAVVAYAGRTAGRLSSALRGVVADEILDEVLRLVEAVWKANLVGELKQESLARAAQRLAEAYYGGVPADMISPDKFRVVFCLGHSVCAAVHAIEAAVNSGRARHEMQSAVKEAQRAVAGIRALKGEAATAAVQAACRDYEVLLRAYGEHDEVIIGEPVDCFDKVS